MHLLCSYATQFYDTVWELRLHTFTIAGNCLELVFEYSSSTVPTPVISEVSKESYLRNLAKPEISAVIKDKQLVGKKNK